jgi:phage baseplate assembly protein gpV
MADRRERMQLLAPTLRAFFRSNQAEVWTSLPGIIESYDAEKQTVSVQPAIQAKMRDATSGEWKNLTISMCVDVPVQFPGNGDFMLTFPIKKGDEGLICFAARCIDSWYQSGGVQPQAELRMHDLSDGFFFPGFRSQPAKIPSVSTDSVQLRNKDKTSFFEIAQDGKVNVQTDHEALVKSGVKITLDAPEVVVKASAKITLDSPITEITGKLVAGDGSGNEITLNGNVTVTGDVKAQSGAVSLVNHTHGGVDRGGGNTDKPNQV